jgi:hypothetical protein
MDDRNEVISIYEGANLTEAHLVKNLLLDEGIEASVSEENDPLTIPISPPHVLVRKADETRARQIIDDYQEHELERADRPDWKCAKCGATVIGALDECDACGADRPGTEEIEDEE